MKITMLTILMVFASIKSFADTMAMARVAELTAHRIERLISLGKIDASYSTRTENIEITAAGPAPVAFKALVSQTKPLQGAPLQIEILFDGAAKPLSFNVIPGGIAGSDPLWTDVNAVSLFEEALHEVLENAENIQFAPFYANLTSVKLTKEFSNNMVVARAQVSSSETAAKLNIYFKLDGTFVSSELVP
jgi:hypothetical protein